MTAPFRQAARLDCDVYRDPVTNSNTSRIERGGEHSPLLVQSEDLS